VTVGQPITTANPQQFTQQGNDLKPYAPAQLGGTRDVSNNFNITWTRRTRLGGAWLNGPNTGTVPLNEDTESYDVEFFQLNGNGHDPLPFYTVSPSGAVNAMFRGFPSGSVIVYVWQPFVSPNTQVTFADGHTASYAANPGLGGSQLWFWGESRQVRHQVVLLHRAYCLGQRTTSRCLTRLNKVTVVVRL